MNVAVRRGPLRTPRTAAVIVIDRLGPAFGDHEPRLPGAEAQALTDVMTREIDPIDNVCVFVREPHGHAIV